MQREFNVTIEWNTTGVPVSSIPQDAHIALEVVPSDQKMRQDPNLPNQIGTVSLSGNRAGLLALAERLIAVAHTDVEGYHEHFDSDFPAGFVGTDGPWELLIVRSDVRAIRKAIKERR